MGKDDLNAQKIFEGVKEIVSRTLTPESNEGFFGESIRSHVERTLNKNILVPGISLDNLGVDSIDRAKILSDLEHNFHIKFERLDETELKKGTVTLGKIVEMVAEKNGITLTDAERASYGHSEKIAHE